MRRRRLLLRGLLVVGLSLSGLAAPLGVWPASAAGGYQMAFQANTTQLWSVGDAGNVNTELGMMPGTSPAIAALPGGGYQMAFQANTTELWSVGDAGAVNTGLGMMPGTSPAIAASPHGGYRIVFQANTGSLWSFSPSTGGVDYQLGMNGGTSPTVAGLAIPGGLLTPPNLGPPDGNGYHWLPDSEPAGLYTPGTSCRRGSLQLIQVIYTVATHWHNLYPGSPVRVRDLNGPNPPHVSHANGVDVDISVGHLTTNQRIELGRLFVDTGIIKFIFYSGADFNTVSANVNQHAGTSTMRYESGHGTHYHVRILDAFRGPTSRTCA